METSEVLIGVVIGVIGSYIATILYNKNSERKKKKIEQKIAELDFEESFLEKISKGNIELIRSCFRTLFISIGITCFSVGIILVSIAVKLPQIIQYNAMIIGSAAIMAAGAIAFSQAKSLIKLKDLKKAKEQIEERRNKLKNKL
ncbi:MAG: hypothetical protein ACRDBQ_11640 [Shewanella sp.]|uniref:hypothetical protein n=1 Tax=Aeromonas veronii TaxID=654 RepID=UPI002417BB99|nr:hypothetical protein [Aeromonas veronii]WFO50024.1 hypothetical protein L1O00_13440 [Aeromonas veronii]